MKVLDLKAPFLHDTPTLYTPPPPPLPRLLPPKVRMGRLVGRDRLEYLRIIACESAGLSKLT